ncbi:MAG: hypothetical protein CR994_07485 [Maribacter sp.]|nr:MAG: hypothetical protein CR994_07485 [Maribacter sp.]
MTINRPKAPGFQGRGPYLVLGGHPVGDTGFPGMFQTVFHGGIFRIPMMVNGLASCFYGFIIRARL